MPRRLALERRVVSEAMYHRIEFVYFADIVLELNAVLYLLGHKFYNVFVF